MGDNQHGHAGFGQVDHDVEHFFDHFRVERGCRLVKKQDFGAHAQRTGDGDALLLSAGELSGELLGLLGDLDPLEILHGDRFGFDLWGFAHPDWRQGAILENGEVGEEVEGLEHHADFATHRIDILEVIGQAGAVDHDPALLMFLKPVNAADQGRLAAA